MRTPTGQYRIDFYNKHGERLRGESITSESLMSSHEAAADTIPSLKSEATSYTVMRCVFNSLDKDANL